MSDHKTLIGRVVFYQRKDQKYKPWTSIIYKEDDRFIYVSAQKNRFHYQFDKASLYIKNASSCDCYVVLGPYLLENRI